MSFMYERKSTGPNTEPCGTPNVMFDIEELKFLTETYCFLLLKYMGVVPMDWRSACIVPLYKGKGDKL